MPGPGKMLEMIVEHSEEFCDIIDESKRRDQMQEASNAIADSLTKAAFEDKEGDEMKSAWNDMS